MEVTLELLEKRGYSHQNSQRTQRGITIKTYQTVKNMFRNNGITGDILDYGAGMGHGSELLSAESFEPYPKDWTPTYIYASSILKQYDGIVCVNVLNVLPQPLRDEAISNIGLMLKVGGLAIVGVRGMEVMNVKTGVALSDTEMYLPNKNPTYQKGFTQLDLKEALESILGRGGEGQYEFHGYAGICSASTMIWKRK